MEYIKSVCVFCGGSPLVSSIYLDAARKLGHLLGAAKIELVYGGGDGGLMGAVSNAAMEKGARVLGFLPEDLLAIEDANTKITQLTIVADMHERKRNMYINTEAFVVLPGGFGTLEELFEVITYKIVGFIRKPIIILDINGYWTPLKEMLDRIFADRFAETSRKDLYDFVETPEKILEFLIKKNENQQDILS